MNPEFIGGDYYGEYKNGRFHGKGIYRHKEMRYEGGFVDGHFHGEGILYVDGGCYSGYWQRGELVEGGFIFDDGLPHLKVGYKFWEYCSQYDHRFYQEIKDGIPRGEQLRDLTAHPYADKLPKDCYDTIDGYYDPKKHLVFSYETNEVIRTPDSNEIDFILTTCRVGK
jgi:hypothetical protein